jgi:hypothetical protein
MPINPDPFHLVRAKQTVEPKTHDEFIESLGIEAPAGVTNRGILFVTDDVEYYKELGGLLQARCYEQGRKFSFRYSDLTVFLEGEHLIRLYELINRGRLAVVREDTFKLRETVVVITKIDVTEVKKGKKENANFSAEKNTTGDDDDLKA